MLLLSFQEGLPKAENVKQVQIYSKDLCLEAACCGKTPSNISKEVEESQTALRAVLLCAKPKLKSFR